MISVTYHCPKDGTYSGEMKLVRTENTYTIDEFYQLKRKALVQLVGERLKCPKCKRVYGWHQLEKREVSTKKPSYFINLMLDRGEE